MLAKHLMAIGILVAWGAGVLADEGFSVSVDKAKQRIRLTTQGQTYIVAMAKGALHVAVNTIKYRARFSVAEKGRAQDWTTAKWTVATVGKDTDTIKEATVICDLSFTLEEPSPKTTRGMALAKGQDPPKFQAQLHGTFRVQKGLPCLFAEYRVVNQGDPMSCYCLPWLASAASYSIPGPDGPVQKSFKGKYAAVAAGKLPWVFMSIGPAKGMGVILPEPKKILVGEYGSKKSKGGAIYLNTIPHKPKLATGGAVSVRLIFTESAGPDALAKLCEQIRKP
jgi:hypothetical protein